MALSLHKSSGGTAGLHIDGDYVSAVNLSGSRIDRAVSRELPPGAMSEGEVTDEGELAAALKELFKRGGLPKSVQLGVANQQIVVRQIELPRIDDEKDLDSAIRFQAAEAIAMPLDEAVLDYQVIGHSDVQGSARMQVIIVAARRAMVERFVAAARSAGLKPMGLDLEAFALVRVLAGDGLRADTARVYCHLGAVTNLAIAAGSNCLFTRTLSARVGSDDVESTGSKLADEVRLSIDYYMAQPQSRPVDELVLAGPGARLEGLADAVATPLGLTARTAEPLGALELGESPAGEDPYRHTVATGLALGAAA